MTESQPVTVRRTSDGFDVYIAMTREAIVNNPSYIMAMLLLGGRKSSWGRFFLCRHWLALVPLGVAIGAMVRFGMPVEFAVVTAPFAAAYYLATAHNVSRIAREIHKRGWLDDLCLIPRYDPFLLLAGFAFAGRYERRRAASAAAAFAGAATITAALLANPPDIMCLLIGATGIGTSFFLARDAALPGARKPYSTTYGAAEDYLISLERDAWLVFSRAWALWLACFALTALGAIGVYYFRRHALEIVLILTTVAFITFRRGRQKELVADVAIMRDRLGERIRAALETK